MKSRNKDKQPIFSVTADDCEWKYTVGSGDGGQKKQKTSSACHCTHRASGAAAFSEAYREQRRNREDAFRKMVMTKKFQSWLKIQISKVTGEEKMMQENVDRQMRKVNLQVEMKDENGRWVPYEENLTKE